MGILTLIATAYVALFQVLLGGAGITEMVRSARESRAAVIEKGEYRAIYMSERLPADAREERLDSAPPAAPQDDQDGPRQPQADDQVDEQPAD